MESTNSKDPMINRKITFKDPLSIEPEFEDMEFSKSIGGKINKISIYLRFEI